LWEGVEEPWNSTIFALSSLLSAQLDLTFPRVTGSEWNRAMEKLAETFHIPFAVPNFEGLSALHPRIVAYLAANFGEEFETDGEELFLRIRPEFQEDPLIRIYLEPGDDSLQLS
jgi:hypothetical protein